LCPPEALSLKGRGHPAPDDREQGDHPHGLGPEVQKYPCANRSGLYSGVLYSLGVISVIAPLGFGLYRGLYARQYYGSVAIVYWSRTWIAVAVLALLIFIYLLTRHWRRKRKFVAVHKKGIKLSLSRPMNLKWAQIHGIAVQESQAKFLSLPIGNKFQVTLYPNIGKQIKMDRDIKDLPELVSRIKSAIYPRLASELSESFQNEQWLYFGSLAVQKDRLRWKKREIPWTSVDKIEVHRGSLIINTRQGSILRLPISNIPNIELLIEIIRKGVANQ